MGLPIFNIRHFPSAEREAPAAVLELVRLGAEHLRYGQDLWAGQVTQQILDKCGQPTSKDGDNWLYDRSDVGQAIYVLHFNDSGQLDSIEQQMDRE